MQKKPVILVVDDEPQLLRTMRASLPASGFEIRTVANGTLALAAINEEMPDLIILDLVMPGISGLDVCREVRKHSPVPIIVLSAKGGDRDKVEALDLGADDYVTKPFSLDELVARIRAVLRRWSERDENRDLIKVDDLLIDLEHRRVTVTNQEVKLTPKEFDLLKFLVERADKVVTHKALLQAVWGGSYEDQTEYLRVFINQLRKKIEANPHKPRFIITIPWVGYRFSLGATDKR